MDASQEAGLALYLVSNAASLVTGATVNIDSEFVPRRAALARWDRWPNISRSYDYVATLEALERRADTKVSNTDLPSDG